MNILISRFNLSESVFRFVVWCRFTWLLNETWKTHKLDDGAPIEEQWQDSIKRSARSEMITGQSDHCPQSIHRFSFCHFDHQLGTIQIICLQTCACKNKWLKNKNREGRTDLNITTQYSFKFRLAWHRERNADHPKVSQFLSIMALLN